MVEVGRGVRIFEHPAVRGVWRVMQRPEDVLGLLDAGARGVVAVVRDAGSTFPAPVYRELSAIVCTTGTPGSHLGIVSRDFRVPCIVGASFPGGEPMDGEAVEVDCSEEDGVVRA